jgi:hypothetical protein
VVDSVLLVDANEAHDVFDVVELTDRTARVRTAYLYEIGEELVVRIARDGAATDVIARVRAHTGPADNRVTELDLVPA